MKQDHKPYRKQETEILKDEYDQHFNDSVLSLSFNDPKEKWYSRCTELNDTGGQNVMMIVI